MKFKKSRLVSLSNLEFNFCVMTLASFYVVLAVLIFKSFWKFSFTYRGDKSYLTLWISYGFIHLVCISLFNVDLAERSRNVN